MSTLWTLYCRKVVLVANSNLLQLIQQIAINAVKTSKPCDYQVGTVVSAKPLKIKMSQSLTLEEEFIHLTRNVTDFKTKFTLDKSSIYHTAHVDPPTDTWADEQDVTIHNALKVGEKVLVIRKSGGQDFIVIDRVVS